MAKASRRPGTKITNNEKLQIQEMVANGKGTKEISEELKRSETAIKKYVNEFKSMISSIDVGPPKVLDMSMPNNELVSLEMYNKALDFMSMQGLDRNVAQARLNITITKLQSSPSSAQELAQLAFGQISASEVIVTKTASGRSGVAVMTEAGSYHGDRHRKRRSHNRKNILFDVKTGKPI